MVHRKKESVVGNRNLSSVFSILRSGREAVALDFAGSKVPVSLRLKFNRIRSVLIFPASSPIYFFCIWILFSCRFGPSPVGLVGIINKNIIYK
ncbi:unnamed protein product, partial [Arabidopsis halleri]